MADRMTLSVNEAARELGVGRNTAYDLVRAGHLPHVRIGRVIRIPRLQLQEWLNEQSNRNTGRHHRD